MQQKGISVVLLHERVLGPKEASTSVYVAYSYLFKYLFKHLFK